MRLVLAPLLFALLAGPLIACQPPDVPGPEDTAAYLGLAPGATTTFTAPASGQTATVEVRQSSVVRDDALVFDVITRQSGFVDDDSTFSIAVGVEDARLVRFADCVTRCGTPSADVPFVAVPLDTGESAQAEVDVAVLENGVEAPSVVEKHTVVVGDEAEVTVPAGTFTGFTVSWTRVRDGDASTSLLTIAPDVGIVEWTTFASVALQRCVPGEAPCESAQ